MAACLLDCLTCVTFPAVMSADDTPAAPQRSKWWVDIVAGSVGGMASVIAGQPFDVIKVHQPMGAVFLYADPEDEVASD